MKGKRNESYHEAMKLMISTREEGLARIDEQRRKQLLSEESYNEIYSKTESEIKLLKMLEQGYALNHE